MSLYLALALSFVAGGILIPFGFLAFVLWLESRIESAKTDLHW